MLYLTGDELVLGEGWLGAQNVCRFPLQALVHLELLPSSSGRALRRNLLLRFVWADGTTTDVEDVGPVAAHRLHGLLERLCGSKTV
jgi:hypothetical protein